VHHDRGNGGDDFDFSEPGTTVPPEKAKNASRLYGPRKRSGWRVENERGRGVWPDIDWGDDIKAALFECPGGGAGHLRRSNE
jgi:hypothetical protein